MEPLEQMFNQMENDNQNYIHSLFSTPLFVTKKYIPEENEKKFIEENFKKHLAKNKFNYTSVDTYILKNSEMKKLKNFIESNLNLFFFEILKFKKHLQVYITQSWLNFNPKGSSHHVHNHKNSIFSGVYYYNLCDTSITFESPYPNPLTGNITDIHDLEEKNVFNTHKVTIKELQNKLILFPSTIFHSVSINEKNDVRISLAFNTFIEGVTCPCPSHLQRLNLSTNND